MNRNLFLYNCIIISSDMFIDGGELLIENGKIKKIGTKDSIKKTLTEDVKSFNLCGRLLLPGFTNPHSHLYSSLSTGLSPVGPNDSFMGVLENFWWPLDAALDEEAVYYSTLSGLLDAVKHGVTCIFDHHASMNYVDGSLDTIKKAISVTGLKACLCFETSNRKSNTNSIKHIAENVRFIEENIDNKNFSGLIGLHANLTLGNKELESVSKIINNSPDNIAVHIHCGESDDDYQFCIDNGFKGPVDRINSFGILSDKSILAHCIHISDTDKKIIIEKQPWVVLNSESNANNRVGRADRSAFDRYLLGTDGMSFDMVSSLRSHYLLGKGLSEDFSELYNLFFKWPSEFVDTYFPETGSLKEGMDADIAVLDYIPKTEINNDNVIGHLVFGAKGGNVFMTISNGNILYHDGKITFTSEQSIINDIKNASKNLQRRYYG